MLRKKFLFQIFISIAFTGVLNTQCKKRSSRQNKDIESEEEKKIKVLQNDSINNKKRSDLYSPTDILFTAVEELSVFKTEKTSDEICKIKLGSQFIIEQKDELITKIRLDKVAHIMYQCPPDQASGYIVNEANIVDYDALTDTITISKDTPIHHTSESEPFCTLPKNTTVKIIERVSLNYTLIEVHDACTDEYTGKAVILDASSFPAREIYHRTPRLVLRTLAYDSRVYASNSIHTKDTEMCIIAKWNPILIDLDKLYVQVPSNISCAQANPFGYLDKSKAAWLED